MGPASLLVGCLFMKLILGWLSSSGRHPVHVLSWQRPNRRGAPHCLGALVARLIRRSLINDAARRARDVIAFGDA